MKSRFINVLIFAAGAAIGSAVTWKIVKTKYEKIAREEIESVKDAFEDRLTTLQGQAENENEDDTCDRQEHVQQINWDELEDLDEEDEDHYVPNETDLNRYATIAGNYSGEYEIRTSSEPSPFINEKGGAENVAKEPYVIAPYDFGELDGYSQIELTYYADEILEDDEYNIITDADELLGSKALTTFGEYEDDAVFVRNERLRTDFQILKDYRTYKEARSAGPDQVGDE